MILQKQVLGACVLALCAGTAWGQSLHATDFLIRVAGGQLETGAVGSDGSAVYPVRVKSGRFGAEGVPNFTNDPGVDAQAGQLIPGMFVGFDITAALRAWDPEAGFVGISPDRLTVRKSGINTQTPGSDAVVPGIIFGQADNNAAARFHHHVSFILNPAQGGTPSGMWLFTWELWTETPGVSRTEPLYIVFGQGVEAAELEIAVGWVEDNLIGSGPGCVADVNGDGVVNFFDVSGFIALYNAQDPRADLAAPFGVWNFFDVSAFIGAYNAGCP